MGGAPVITAFTSPHAKPGYPWGVTWAGKFDGDGEQLPYVDWSEIRKAFATWGDFTLGSREFWAGQIASGLSSFQRGVDDDDLYKRLGSLISSCFFTLQRTQLSV